MSLRHLPKLGLIALIGLLTVLAAVIGFRHDANQLDTKQTGLADNAAAIVTQTFEASGARLGDVATGVGVDRSIRASDFDRLARPLLSDNSITAVAFARKLPNAQRAAYERARGRPVLADPLQGDVIAPLRDEYYVIDRVVQLEERFRLGADTLLLPDGGETALNAIRTGEPKVTEATMLAGDGEIGLVAYVPVFASVDGEVPPTFDARLGALKGFTLGLYEAKGLTAAIEASLPSGSDLVLSDGETVLGRTGGRLEAPVRRDVSLAGQTWTLDVGRGRSSGLGLGWVAILLGSALTALVALFVFRAYLTERRALDLVALRMAERDRAEAEVRLQSEITAHLLEGVMLVREDGAIVYVNQAWERMFGYDASEVMGRHHRDLTADRSTDEWAEVATAGQAALSETGAWTGECPCRRKDGGKLRVSSHVSCFDHPDHGPVYVALQTDVTEQREASDALAEAKERFRLAFAGAPIGMALMDLEGRFTSVNQALCDITGFPEAELKGRQSREITHPDDRELSLEALDDLLSGEIETHQVEKRYLHATGAAVWVQLSATLLRDSRSEALHYLLQVQDITERRRFHQQLKHMADHDPLTGLFNRRAFEHELDHHVSRVARYGVEGAVLVLDLDHFKYVNDVLGHNAGEGLIISVAKALRERLRDTDVLARLGGDEFAVLLPRADEAEAREVAGALVERLRQESVSGRRGHGRRVTTSIGAALFEEGQPPNGEDILVHADVAMYEAKESGRDRFVVYSNSEHQVAGMRARVDWAERIRHALEHDHFELHLQPILELATGEVSQHEALLRMRGDDGELIPPGAFLDVAERFDLIQDVDNWVAGRAIAMMAELCDSGHDLCVEVNVSGRSMGESRLLETIESALTEHGVSPHRLILEVTETAAVANIPRAREFAERLGELGCRFALDDFGAGFGSFYYLKHLPFDFLKIDGEFVRNCVGTPTDQLVIKAVVEIARGLGKRTVAEFVGDEATVELLRRHGVDFAQGFHVGEPAPVAELPAPAQAPA
ncbi:hypothetical protein BH20ACT19_BH20ACT19_04230 [soil metagenome]